MKTHIRKEDVEFYAPKVRILDKEGQEYGYKYEWDQIELEKIMQEYGD